MTLRQHIIAFLTKHNPKEPGKTKQEKSQEDSKKADKKHLGIREQELEFEESRNMLQADLFHTADKQDVLFPQFEHLLTKPARPKSVTQSLRRKLSFSGRLSRVKSTPDFSKRKHDTPVFNDH